jgi:DNA polymerase-3 subunit delta'
MVSRDLYAAVPGHERTIEQLMRAAANPVHAYLFVGPTGVGTRELALGFAASLLCPNGGDATCRVCRQVLAGSFIDLDIVERSGAYISIDTARAIVAAASVSPVEGRRKVLILVDFHLLREAGPALLKTIEEAPPSTVFIVLADLVTPELVTIASRCVRFDLGALSGDAVAGALEAEGVDAAAAAEAARDSGGSLDRARLLAADPEMAERRHAWEGVPARLDGTGAAVASTVADLLQRVDTAQVFEALKARQAGESADFDAQNKLTGQRRSRRDLDDRHKREQRRLRTDELRWGLGLLAGTYRDRAARGRRPDEVATALAGVDAVQSAADALERNPNDVLLLEALLVRLQPPR